MWDWNLFLDYLLEYATLFPGMAASLLPVWDDLRARPFKPLMLGGIAAYALAGAGLSTAFGLATNTLLLPGMIGMLLLYRRACGLAWGKLLFTFFNAMMICAWPTTLVNYLFAQWIGEIGAPFPHVYGAICLVLDAVLLLIFGPFLHQKLPALFDMPHLDRLWPKLSTLPLAFCIYLVWVVPFDPHIATLGRVQSIFVVTLFAMLLLFFCSYQLLWYIAGHLGKEAALRQENLLLHAEEERYHQLQENLRQTRHLRHDFRQHLRVLSEMAKSNEIDQLRQYLSDYVGSITAEHEHYSANPAVDAIAAYYQGIADSQRTVIAWNLKLPRELPIRDNDCCMILGNLLENALKAAAELPEAERLVKVCVQMIGDGMLGMSISNRYAGKIVLGKNGLPVNPNREGIGLISISSVVRQRGGSMVIETENGWFTVNILFNV